MNEPIVAGNTEEQNTKPEQQTLKNLRLNMWQVASYRPRPQGRMAELVSYYDKGGCAGARGYSIGLSMIVRNDDNSSTHSFKDPSVRVTVPTKRYSKMHYWELLLKLDPIAPELCAAFESDQNAGARLFKEKMQELFGLAETEGA
jgi:hypothetical protein